MGWTNPTSRAMNDLITAGIWNTDLVNNLKEVWRVAAYASSTSSVDVTATTAGAANVLVTAPAFTPDGVSPVYVEFGAPEVQVFGNGAFGLELYDGASGIGSLAIVTPFSTVIKLPVRVQTAHFVPSSTSHTYSVRVWYDEAGAGGGSASVNAGAGGAAGTLLPMFVRVWSKGGP